MLLFSLAACAFHADSKKTVAAPIVAAKRELVLFVHNIVSFIGELATFLTVLLFLSSILCVFKATKRLTEDTMSQHLRGMEYAVRGKVVIAADKISDELSDESFKNKYPFDHIVYTNIGNPHSVGGQALTWPRQVIALVELPREVGVDHPMAKKMFPADAIERAREVKKALNFMGTGAYTHSKGARMFREDIAAFIEERDGGVPCDPESIFMTNGASSAIQVILQTLVADSTWCVV